MTVGKKKKTAIKCATCKHRPMPTDTANAQAAPMVMSRLLRRPKFCPTQCRPQNKLQLAQPKRTAERRAHGQHEVQYSDHRALVEPMRCQKSRSHLKHCTDNPTFCEIKLGVQPITGARRHLAQWTLNTMRHKFEPTTRTSREAQSTTTTLRRYGH